MSPDECCGTNLIGCYPLGTRSYTISVYHTSNSSRAWAFNVTVASARRLAQDTEVTIDFWVATRWVGADRSVSTMLMRLTPKHPLWQVSTLSYRRSSCMERHRKLRVEPRHNCAAAMPHRLRYRGRSEGRVCTVWHRNGICQPAMCRVQRRPVRCWLWEGLDLHRTLARP